MLLLFLIASRRGDSMADIDRVAADVASATTWNASVALIRQIPEAFGTADHASVYSAVAQRAYVPSVKSEFAYIHWRPEYELDAIDVPYRLAHTATHGFNEVSAEQLATLFLNQPRTLRVFRLIL